MIWVRSMDLKIVKYELGLEQKWDEFVLQDSHNGTFLQTRRFLSYHGERFRDCSLIVYKGNGTIAAVIPACEIGEQDEKIFSSHCGSTFGGIVIGKLFYDIEHIEAITELLECYVREEGFKKIQIKCTPAIFCCGDTELLNYYFYKNDYAEADELSCIIDLRKYKEDILSNFTKGKRRDYKYSLKNKLRFKKLETEEEIADFYDMLCDNLKKYNTKPVHTLAELMDFKANRLKEEVEFYGVYFENVLVAGTMVFLFDERVFHIQYHVSRKEYLKYYSMNYLDKNLIEMAKNRKYNYFSFGTSTEQRGKVLNKSLAVYKEGFGGEYAVNREFEKVIINQDTREA